MKRPSLPLTLLLLALFLAPWIGGQLTLDAQALQPGLGSFLEGLWGGDTLPAFAHALIAGLAFLALGLVCWREKALQTPSLRVGIPVIGLIVILGSSILLSKFKFVSAQEWLEWVAYGGAFFAVVAAAGRATGPRLIMAAVAAGSSLAAIRGLLEYGSMRAVDPSWRIFGGYNNPNALATMMLMGIFCALALMLDAHRLGKILAGLAAILMGFALVLTQSKGGYLAAGFGLVVFLICVGVWAGWKRAAMALIPFLIVGVLAFGLKASLSGGSDGGALGRVTASASSSEQSAGFRKLLWSSALRQIQKSPQGLGVGTYGFHSARTGLVQQTHFTHNTYLQLAVEGSPVAALFLGVSLVFWLYESLRSARKLPPNRNLLRAGLIAAILAATAHGLVDSGLYYFGIGFVFFGLMATSLQLGADGSGPELVPPGLRKLSAFSFCFLPAIGLLYFGYVEYRKAAFLGAATSGTVAMSEQSSPIEIAPWDSEALYLQARLSPTDTIEQRISLLKQAVETGPRTRYIRALAQMYLQQGKTASAKTVLAEVLKEDPNNLRALDMLLSIQRQEGDLPAARETALRMINVENSPYLHVTAIPQFVETETLFARELLADESTDPRVKARLLREAVDGLKRYATVTIPAIKQNVQGDTQGSFLGETAAEAQSKLERARALAEKLRRLYRGLGDSSGEDAVTEAEGVFDGALATLNGGNK